MRTFRLLQPEEIECRIAEIGKDGSYLTLLLYKTARTDAALLDEKFGPLGWANDYRVIDGKMYCGIGIRSGDNGEWVWKWNVGTESNTEAEKGEASDAMKRAGFVWGIGTELYSAPRIYVNNDACNIKPKNNGNGFVCYDRFDVKHIAYGSREEITELEIVNTKTGRVAFSMGGRQSAVPTGGTGERIATSPAAPRNDNGGPGSQTRMDAGYKCRRCKAPISEKVYNYATQRFGMPLCGNCQGAALAYERQQAEEKKNAGAQ